MKPVPVSVAELTVTAAVPEEVSVSALVTMVFTGTFPNARALELTVSWGEVPVPLRATVVVFPPEELLEMVNAPLAAPATVGSKLI